MPRNVRIEFAGAFYHVMARGNRREEIFADDLDRSFFLRTLGEACGMTGWEVHAWVLMSNHYHLMIRTPEPNLVEGMKWLQNTYTRRFNTRHRLWGRLFGDRYKSVVVEGEHGDYYGTLLDYIHLNPIRAGLVDVLGQGQSVLEYPWSSVAGGYALPVRRRAPWLAVAEGLAAFGFGDDASGRRKFVARLDRRAVEEAARRCGVPEPSADLRQSHLRRGWYWGTQAFAEKLLALAEKKIESRGNRTYRSGTVKRAHGEKQAVALVEEGLVEVGLTVADLPAVRGNDPRKIAIARKVWEQTTVSMGWIAERLQMKSAANVSQILRCKRLEHGVFA